MDHKKSPNRTKRQAKVLEENYWDCSVCTYRNTAEAFKCLMCDVRKGTSTRKPRINPQLVAQFNPAPPPPVKTSKREGSSSATREKSRRRGGAPRRTWPRLKNIDRSSGQTREITVNNVTVVITEYKPKKKKNNAVSDSASDASHSDSEHRPDQATDSRSS